MWKQNIDWLPPACLPRIKPATQACTWPGIEPTLQCMELHPTNWATIARASTLYLQIFSPSVFYNLSWKWHITSVIHTNPRTMWEGFTQNFFHSLLFTKLALDIRYDIKWRPQLVILECLPWGDIVLGILSTLLLDRQYFPHFTDEEIRLREDNWCNATCQYISELEFKS